MRFTIWVCSSQILPLGVTHSQHCWRSLWTKWQICFLQLKFVLLSHILSWLQSGKAFAYHVSSAAGAVWPKKDKKSTETCLNQRLMDTFPPGYQVKVVVSTSHINGIRWHVNSTSNTLWPPHRPPSNVLLSQDQKTSVQWQKSKIPNSNQTL